MSYVRRSLIALLIVLFAPVLWSAGVADAKDKISKADAKNISQCTPVSYTHLDVYKRQVLPSTMAPASRSLATTKASPAGS